MKTACSSVLAVLVIALATQAQPWPPDTLWTRTFGTTVGDQAFRIRQTSEGGYILTGESNSSPGTVHRFSLWKLDTQGESVWQRDFLLGNCCGFCVQQTADGGYVAVGTGTQVGNNWLIYLVKVDAQGDSLWCHILHSGEGMYVQQTADGGYIVTGWEYLSPDNLDVILIKTDFQGMVQWENTYGGPFIDRGACVQQTSDGGYIIAATKQSGGVGDPYGDVWLIRTDASGVVLWDSLYGGNNADHGQSVRITADGGYILGASTWSFGAGMYDVWLIKTDEQGRREWDSTYGDSGVDVCCEVQQTSDGGYVVAGSSSNETTQSYDFSLYRMQENGRLLWNTLYGGSACEQAYSVDQTSDGGYVIAGRTTPLDSIWSDVQLVRVDNWPITIELAPQSPPIVLPDSGGTFSFQIEVTNHTQVNQRTRVWTMIQVPGGGQVIGLNPVTVNLPPQGSLSRLRTQSIPPIAPPGQYLYWGFLGDPYWTVNDADSFSFTKLVGSASGLGPGEWFCGGEPFPGELSENAPVTPALITIKAQPNPFNLATTLSYELPTSGPVSLTLYDTTGRAVSTLVNGYRPAGRHSFTFEGTGWASGIYLVKLQSGDFTAVQKLVLLK